MQLQKNIVSSNLKNVLTIDIDVHFCKR